MSKIRLHGDLELLVLGSLLSGKLPTELAKKDEFGKTGQYIYEAIDRMRRVGEPPYDVQAVTEMAVVALGGDADDIRPAVKKASLIAGSKEVGEVVKTIRDRQVIVDLLDTATKQLQECTLDRSALLAHLEEAERADALVPMSTLVGTSLPEPPTGVRLKSFPRLSDVTGGLFGMWAVAGEPAVGKSTLALQMALHYAQERDVLYYDFENGAAVQLHRLGVALGSVEKLKEKTQRLYLRETIKWMETDLAQIRPPALVVIDSVQKLPSSVEFRRNSIDKWILKLEALKKRGYDVLVLSEKNRASYGSATLSAFKESSEIEYTADTGIQLLEGSGVIELHVVKNRHHPEKGHVADLTRTKGFWFAENDVDESEERNDL